MFEVLECLFWFSAFCGKLCRLFIKRHIELIDSESFLGRPQSLSQVAVMLIDCGQVRIKRRIIRIRIAQLFEILLSIFKIFLLKLDERQLKPRVRIKFFFRNLFQISKSRFEFAKSRV